MSDRIHLLLLTALALGCADGRAGDSQVPEAFAHAGGISDAEFAELVERLSEPGGYFDTDNLISNETSYLHVVGKLHELSVSGGAYIGVGPDQNFSYMKEIRPEIAFIVDIRRDNLLQHLMFKAMFELADNRIEYLCLLFARPLPEDVGVFRKQPAQSLVDYIDSTTPSADLREEVMARVASTVAAFALPLTDQDVNTVRRFHSTFIDEGLGLRFRSHGRRPNRHYPTYRQLLLETDLAGRQANYLAEEASFQYLKQMQERNLVIPVVGDLAGDHALVAVGGEISKRGKVISAFYTSNVEYYLVQDRSFHKYAHAVGRLPYDSASVIIRSFFAARYAYQHPQAVPGYHSVQLLQQMATFIDDYEADRYRSYLELVSLNAIDLK
jgi:hypothetical protein